MTEAKVEATIEDYQESSSSSVSADKVIETKANTFAVSPPIEVNALPTAQSPPPLQPSNDNNNNNDDTQTCSSKWKWIVQQRISLPIKFVVLFLSNLAAKYPYRCIILTVIISLALMVAGLFTNFYFESNENELWKPIGSMSANDGDWLDSSNPDKYFYTGNINDSSNCEYVEISYLHPDNINMEPRRRRLVQFEQEEISDSQQQQRQLQNTVNTWLSITALVHNHGGNVVTKEGADRLFEVHETAIDTPGYHTFCQNYSRRPECPLRDLNVICEHYNVSTTQTTCERRGPTAFFLNNINVYHARVSNDHDVQVALSPDYYPSYYNLPDIPLQHVVGYPIYTQQQGNNNLLVSGQSYTMVFVIPGIDNGWTIAKELEERLLELRDEWDHDESCGYALEINSAQAFQSEFQRGLVGDIPFVGLAFVIMTLFTMTAFSKLQRPQTTKSNRCCFQLDGIYSRSTLGFGAIVTVLLSITSGYGLLFCVGVPFTSITQLLPFVMFGIGVDDAFIIMAAYLRTTSSSQTDAISRIRETFEEVGVSVFMTTLTSTVAFVLGSIFSTIPAVRWLCLYAWPMIVIDFVYQITFFVALIVLDERRVQNHRRDCCCLCCCCCCTVVEQQPKQDENVKYIVPPVETLQQSASQEEEEEEEYKAISLSRLMTSKLDVLQEEDSSANIDSSRKNSASHIDSLRFSSSNPNFSHYIDDLPEETGPIESLEETGPIESLEETAPIESLEETAPIESLDGTTPIESLEERAPIESLQETAPAESLKETTTVNSIDEINKKVQDQENYFQKEEDVMSKLREQDQAQKTLQQQDEALLDEKHVAERIMMAYTDILLRPRIKALVLLIFAAFFAVCAYSASLMTIEFDFTSVLPRNSYVAQFYDALGDYAQDATIAPYVYFRFVDQSDPKVQKSMRQYVNDLVRQVDGISGQPPNFWLRDYQKFMRENQNNQRLMSLPFNDTLVRFLRQEEHRRYWNDLTMDSERNILMSRVRIYLDNIDITNVDEYLGAFQDIRQVGSQQAANQQTDPWCFFTFEGIFYLWEFLHITVEELIVTTICGVSAVAVMTLLFMPYYSAVFLVTPMVMVLFVDLVGFLQFFHVSVNGVSFIALLMSIGLLVDFIMHVTLRYYESTKIGRIEKTKDTLRTMGASVLLGGISTFLGTLSLVFTSTSIFETIFISFCGIVSIGITHGLVLFPVILSISGPQ